jgi:hypothetical protein
LATRHSKGTTYLILALVLPEGTDADAAAQLLADRVRNYVSIASGEPLGITWPLELVAGLEHVGQPTALVVIRVDDPSPLPADADSADAMVLGWYPLLVHGDTLFLLPERGDD